MWGWSQTAGHCSPPAASKQSAGQRQILAAAFAASLNLCPVYRPPQIHKSHYYNHQVYMLHFYPLHTPLPRSTGPINISISIFAAPAYPLPRLNTHTTLHLPYISTSPDPLVMLIYPLLYLLHLSPLHTTLPRSTSLTITQRSHTKDFRAGETPLPIRVSTSDIRAITSPESVCSWNLIHCLP